tara:strand:- start:15604 stop:15744 length:141 start_codon:yes stop_codon:yes gene_type:complete
MMQKYKLLENQFNIIPFNSKFNYYRLSFQEKMKMNKRQLIKTGFVF